jgi:hypothetical protein
MNNYLFSRLPAGGIILIIWGIYLFSQEGENYLLPIAFGITFLVTFFSLKNSKYAGLIEHPMNKTTGAAYALSAVLIGFSLIGTMSGAISETVNAIAAFGGITAMGAAYYLHVKDFLKSNS